MNLVHSIATRLLDLSRKNREDHHFVLVRYGSERLSVIKQYIENQKHV